MRAYSLPGTILVSQLYFCYPFCRLLNWKKWRGQRTHPEFIASKLWSQCSNLSCPTLEPQHNILPFSHFFFLWYFHYACVDAFNGVPHFSAAQSFFIFSLFFRLHNFYWLIVKFTHFFLYHLKSTVDYLLFYFSYC